LIRQLAVIFLSLVPFAISIMAAYLTWAAFPSIELWHMVATTLVWVVSFAAGTALFWKVTELLAIKR
jgi:hypothetical protein